MRKHTLILVVLVLLGEFTQCSEDSTPKQLSTHDTTQAGNKITDTLVKIDSLVPAIKTITDSIYSFQDYNTGKYGYKNKKGKVIIRPKFTAAKNFYGLYAPVIYQGKHGFSDTSGKVIFLLKYHFVTHDNELSGETYITGDGDGLIAVQNTAGLCGYMNYQQEMIIPFTYEEAQPFSQGLAAVSKNNKFGYIDKTGKVCIDFTYELANIFSDNRACVTIKDKKGYINKKGELVIPAIYNNTYFFSEGLAHVCTESDYTNYFYIDTTGKTIIKGLFENATPFKKGRALVQKNGKCLEIDKTGKKTKYLGTNCFEGC